MYLIFDFVKMKLIWIFWSENVLRILIHFPFHSNGLASFGPQKWLVKLVMAANVATIVTEKHFHSISSACIVASHRTFRFNASLFRCRSDEKSKKGHPTTKCFCVHTCSECPLLHNKNKIHFHANCRWPIVRTDDEKEKSLKIAETKYRKSSQGHNMSYNGVNASGEKNTPASCQWWRGPHNLISEIYKSLPLINAMSATHANTQFFDFRTIRTILNGTKNGEKKNERREEKRLYYKCEWPWIQHCNVRCIRDDYRIAMT